MYGRDKYTSRVICSACNQVGLFEVSEENYPDHGDWKFQVDEVPKGFRLVRLGVNIDDCEILCEKCGAKGK